MSELERLYLNVKLLKRRPEMFINPYNYYTLVAYISGYNNCSYDMNKKQPLDGLNDWVHLVLGHVANAHWSFIILKELAKNDEDKAIELFFGIFDDFYQAVISEGVEAIKARAEKMVDEHVFNENE